MATAPITAGGSNRRSRDLTAMNKMMAAAIPSTAHGSARSGPMRSTWAFWKAT